MILTAVLALLVAGYAQHRLAFHAASARQLWITRLMLLAVGLAFGWAMSNVYLDAEGVVSLWVFVTAFGVTHLPAAIILWLKKQRNKQEK
ncbi:MAG: hypothetical protein KGY54_03505 [Oleiphilaceae bacterium]|nr:hypothetical protein [Oleiphilaceae bacterium]